MVWWDQLQVCLLIDGQLISISDVFVPVVSKMMPAIVCQGTDKTLSCSNTSMVLVINKAWYGREDVGKIICPYNSKLEKDDVDDKTIGCQQDVKPKLRKLCHKRKTCQLSARKKVFGRPCKGIYKYLQIIYACGKYNLKILLFCFMVNWWDGKEMSFWTINNQKATLSPTVHYICIYAWDKCYTIFIIFLYMHRYLFVDVTFFCFLLVFSVFFSH